jgi:23S rRNA (cytosine1962-C5)-methyltransferase
MSKNRNTARLRLRVSAAAESKLRAGHPWVFADSIREQNREGHTGELAVIYDRKDEFLAIGLFDPDSPIRIRVLHTGKPQTIDAAWWSSRLAQAVDRRRDWFDARTTGYRLINGESDGWPGLVLDRYDTTLVLKLYTAAWLPRLEEFTKLLRSRLDPENLVLRLSRNLEHRSLRPLSRSDRDYGGQAIRRDGEFLFQKRAGLPVLRSSTAEGGEAGAPVVFLETGLRFQADVCRGQKTGFFLDQRENRRKVESLARGRRVLNAFSFSGGFSLYAARGGATSATDLDLSAHALAAAKENFRLNAADKSIARCRHELVQANAFEWLKANARRRFDLIILDPPSFAKRESERVNAIRAYEQLASLGIAQLAPDGILLACSCSAHVTAEEFFAAVRRAAVKTKRPLEELQTTRHASDHPATFTEAEYLKAIYLRL